MNIERKLNTRIARSLVSGSLIALSLGFIPSSAIAATPVPATLHIVTVVNNTHGGLATPSTFMMHVTQNGVDVTGSPISGLGTPGRTFTLPPGTYILTNTPHADYGGKWSGSISSGGTIQLASGDNVTVTRTMYDILPTGTTPTTPTTTTPTDTTVTGGTLPTTATPWENILVIGFGLIVLGGIGAMFRRKISS